jgi:preprotein translocase subunit SecG
MLYGLFIAFFIFVCFLLVLIIMAQQGKGGGIGFGGLGGGSQMLFGGSGGQDLFQKITWVLGAIFVFSSFGLTVWKTRQGRTGFLPQHSVRMRMPEAQQPEPSQAPAPTTSTTE